MTNLKQRAEEILKLRAAATPGPWIHNPLNRPDELGSIFIPTKADGTRTLVALTCMGKGLIPNAAFIAKAHDMADLIQELLAENEALRQDAERLDALAELADYRKLMIKADEEGTRINYRSMTGRVDYFGDDLRAAIDAARNKE